ncbi:potassium channel family protein [Deinococcus humi]|uniref:Potassium channel domain-containing protein n=1 Tax=Deinococcus humi TaxID=662880 RepID=A0A7W8JU66_9DEIO|nr:potassium channel family protein [Deinococcus humi]MBB5363290.1 hypothetical protein [Deinococcus humi]GGO27273.1 hypothetical protein GCM10008949_18780 [Deinococcus humi]
MDTVRQLLWLPGAALVLAVLLDALLSGLQAGEGTLSRWIHRPVYAAVQWLARVTRRRSVLAWSTLALISVTLNIWTALLWLGWGLVFWAWPGALEVAKTGQPASFGEVMYFVGYSISTLGLGDIIATDTLWRVLTDVTAISGFFLLTFAITFIVPVSQARSARRQFALLLYRAGPDAQTLVVDAARGYPDGLQGLLDDLHTQLNTLDAQHLSTPNLHRFHEHEQRQALDAALPKLGEALLIIGGALDMDPPRGLRRSLDSVDSLTRSYGRVHSGPDASVPPPPDLRPLAEAGLSLRPAAEFAAYLQDHHTLRRRLHDMAQSGGWRWDEVAQIETSGR